jgi:hypothetical protein
MGRIIAAHDEHGGKSPPLAMRKSVIAAAGHSVARGNARTRNPDVKRQGAAAGFRVAAVAASGMTTAGCR